MPHPHADIRPRAARLSALRAPILCAGLLSLPLAATPVMAQDTTNFGLELNNARAAGEGCRLTYVANNNTGTDLETTSYEVAVFDQEGVVSRLLILEFGELRDGKTKVVQFDLADMGCEEISRLLLNSVSECTAEGGAEADCLDGLVTSSRADIQFGI